MKTQSARSSMSIIRDSVTEFRSSQDELIKLSQVVDKYLDDIPPSGVIETLGSLLQSYLRMNEIEGSNPRDEQNAIFEVTWLCAFLAKLQETRSIRPLPLERLNN